MAESVGQGQGYFACEGKIIPIIWNRETNESPFTFTLTDGTPLEQGIGNSYIAMATLDSEVIWEAAEVPETLATEAAAAEETEAMEAAAVEETAAALSETAETAAEASAENQGETLEAVADATETFDPADLDVDG